jgi:hypothetical protein
MRLADERGVALVMALGMLMVLTISVASVVAYSGASSRSAADDRSRQRAFSLAEAGINNARAILFAALDPRDPSAVPEQTAAFDGGTVTYSGSYDEGTEIWTLTATSTVPNPTGGEAITRTVTSRLHVASGSVGSEFDAVWNYLYSDTTSSCMTLANNSNIAVPLYVRGNLCLNNNAKITGSTTTVQVGGTLTLGSGAKIGESVANPIATARIAGGCTGGSPNPHPCTTLDRVYATTYETATEGLVKPPADFELWYENARPGPSNPCTSGSNFPQFDNDTTLNGLNPTFNLLPATAYNCTASSGYLRWTPGDPGTLEISGTIFFDGGLTIPLDANAVYQGRGTIYANGKILFENNARLCGVAACDTTWDTNANLLVLVAGSNAVSPQYAFELTNNAVFQGASYAVGDFREANNTGVWGSVIANKLHLANNAINHYVPYGTLLPGMPGGAGEVTYLEDVSVGYGGG